MGECSDCEKIDREILDRLMRIETRVDIQISQWEKIESHAIAIAKLEASAKQAHNRLDMMQATNADIKKELSEVIKEQVAGIYRTASLMGAVSGFFVGIIMWLLKQ